MSFLVYLAASLPRKPPDYLPAVEVLEEFLAALRERCASERIAYLANEEDV